MRNEGLATRTLALTALVVAAVALVLAARKQTGNGSAEGRSGVYQSGEKIQVGVYLDEFSRLHDPRNSARWLAES